MRLVRTETYDNGNPVLRSPHWVATQHRTLDPMLVTANALGQKTFNNFWVGDAPNGFGRILPRARITTAALATNSPTVNVTDARLFVTNDVLVCPVPSAAATFALTWANNDTATATFFGQTFSHVVSGFSTLTALAASFATAFNAHPPFIGRVSAISSGAAVFFFSEDGFPHTIATGVTVAGNGTFAITDTVSTMRTNLSVGTVSVVNPTTNVITLAANAARVLPIGAPVGVVSMPIGFFPGQIDLNNNMPSLDVGLMVDGDLIASNLGYYDGEIRRLLPGIRVH